MYVGTAQLHQEHLRELEEPDPRDRVPGAGLPDGSRPAGPGGRGESGELTDEDAHVKNSCGAVQ
jgi:hypothetical protein